MKETRTAYIIAKQCQLQLTEKEGETDTPAKIEIIYLLPSAQLQKILIH